MRKRGFRRLKAIYLSTFLLLSILVFACPTIIVGSSMSPTIDNMDLLLINHFFYKTRTPNYNDIVVIKSEVSGGNIIKRVIAVAGDHIRIKNCSLYVNNTKLHEEYLKEEDLTNYDIEMVIPKGKVFVLGDNRNISRDSRDCSVCCIDIRNIKGRAYFRLYPLFSTGRI